MYFEEFGNKEKEILVLLHTSFNPYIYDSLIDLLKDDYRIIVPHLLGFGKEVDKIFTFEENENELINLISSFNKKVYLIGTSLGSQISYRLMNSHQELFSKVILVSPFLLKDQIDITASLNANMKLLNNVRNRFLIHLYMHKNNIRKDRRNDFKKESKKIIDESIFNMVNDSPSISDYPNYNEVNVPTLLVSFTSQHIAISRTIDELLKTNAYTKDIIVQGNMINLLSRDVVKFKKIINDYLLFDKVENEVIKDEGNAK